MNFSVVLAVYNESENIAPHLQRIRQVIQPSDELVVVDDGSTDGTAERIDPKQARVIRCPVNQGKGAAIQTGIEAASGDILLLMDGDGQDDPQDIPKLLEPFKNGQADFVIGSRFLTPGQKGFVTHLNRLGNKGLTLWINFLFGVSLTDSQSAFKAIRAEALKSFRLKSRRYEIESEILIKAIRKKLKIVEVPVARYERKHGKSKLYQVPLGRLRFGLRVVWVILKGYFLWH